MAEYIRALVTLPSGTGIPADAATNTFHFSSESAGSPVAAAEAAVTALETFYQALDGVLFGSTVVTPAAVKCYDLTDTSPRVPVVEDTIVLSTVAGNCLPTECSICLTGEGVPVSGQNQARRRGRVYLGPLLQSNITTASGRVIVHASTISAIVSAAQALAGITGPPDIIWSVFSPTLAGPEPWSESQLNSAFTAITRGWVDNAMDTQRRRGTEPTARTLWTN